MNEIKLQLEARIVKLKSYIIDNSLFSTVIDDEIKFLQNIVNKLKDNEKN